MDWQLKGGGGVFCSRRAAGRQSMTWAEAQKPLNSGTPDKYITKV
ncbi:hypothetical protein ARTSIC4J27_3787 [Pseudarthrobacter siccitolerans]|uniref:Uncharacterized protein n=1 Tax=Pseudarthrobacter siccitolerans TaxID=861266 RepID=A0A024H7R0_9MICC|nr:hypothetical protein ARTSIC4J27_3787 [Pseudarthrobacter siccitolerans]